MKGLDSLKVKRVERREGKPVFLGDSRSDIRLFTLRITVVSVKRKTMSPGEVVLLKLDGGRAWCVRTAASLTRSHSWLLQVCETYVDDF